MTDEQKNKKELLQVLLDTGYSVMMYVDTTTPNKEDKLGVVIPKNLYDKSLVVFEIGYYMSRPIPDLHLADDGVSCTLSFSGNNELCFFPWEKIAAFSGEAFAKMAESEKAKLQNSLPKLSVAKEIKPELKDTKVPWLKIVK